MLKVVVDYQGPRVIRPLVNALGVTFFDRVTAIESDLNKVTDFRLTKSDIEVMESLQRITVRRKSNKDINQADVDFVIDAIPDCRKRIVQNTGNEITVSTASASFFLGCTD